MNTQVYVQVDLSQCHVMTDRLMRYALIGEPNMAGKAIKILRIAAFGPAVVSAVDYNLRVYFVEDTMDALEVGRYFANLINCRSCSKSLEKKLDELPFSNLLCNIGLIIGLLVTLQLLANRTPD